MISALLAGAFLLAGASKASPTEPLMCVDSFDATAGSISIFFDTAYDFVPKIQHISEVKNTTINETIASLGMCPAVLTDNGRTN